MIPIIVMSDTFVQIASSLISVARGLHARGWLLGTSGNLSVVVDREPLSLAITPSGADKGELTPAQILLIDEHCKCVDEPRVKQNNESARRVPAGASQPSQLVLGNRQADPDNPQSDLDNAQPVPGKPSDESPLHVAIVKARGAGAVIHTHSVWATILSDGHTSEGGIAIEGYEMLKGLHGVSTHLHREWIPIIDNSQDMPALANTINEVLAQYPGAHALLLRRHGLYTWGRDLKEAKRHVEILEFLLEAVGRKNEILGAKEMLL
jgi:methylthioribulose-1-phosphate dehydratase